MHATSTLIHYIYSLMYVANLYYEMKVDLVSVIGSKEHMICILY